MVKRLLDLSRTASRLNHAIATGIDRVEAAYLDEIIKDEDSRFLVRYRYGLVYLFDGTGIKKALRTTHRSKLERSISFFRHAKKTIHHRQLEGLYTGLATEGFEYYNIGHSHLNATNWRALKAAQMKSTVMVHDVIPLDFPEYCRDDRLAPFETAMRHVFANADCILTPSAYSKSRIEHWRAQWNLVNVQDIVVNPLGVSPMTNKRSKPSENAFLTVGTIEARKNHIFLLHLWGELFDVLGEATPQLWIVGARGWKIDDIDEWMAKDHPVKRFIHFLGPIRDTELAAYATRARALLFPSYVEGFGLPLFEAVSAGIPTLASDIPVFREVLLEKLTLLRLNSLTEWRQSILEISDDNVLFSKEKFPNWREHFAVTFDK